jgi:hypothetical protein
MVHCASTLLNQPDNAEDERKLFETMVSCGVVEFCYRNHVFAIPPHVNVKVKV